MMIAMPASSSASKVAMSNTLAGLGFGPVLQLGGRTRKAGWFAVGGEGNNRSASSSFSSDCSLTWRVAHDPKPDSSGSIANILVLHSVLSEKIDGAWTIDQ
jgi:hypothetical protein